MNNKKLWVSLVAGILAAIMILSLILGLLPQSASATQSSSEIKEQIEQMEKENAEMEAQIDALKGQFDELKGQQTDTLSKINQIVSQKSLIDQQVGLLHARVLNMNEQIAAYNVLIADMQEEVETAELRLQELNDKYKERIRTMEEDGNVSYWSVLFEANSFFDLLDRLNMIQEIAAADSRRLQELRAAAQEVEDSRSALLAEREELELAKEALNVTQSELLLKSAEAQTLLSELTVTMEELKLQEGAYEELMGEYEDRLEELEIAIGKAESDLDEALYQEYLATLTTATTAPTYNHGSNAGAGLGGDVVVDESGMEWVVPCDYRKVSSAFGWRVHPVYHDWRHHNGVDLDADCLMRSDGTTDSPIFATQSGVVVVSKWSDSAGWYVTIDHLNGYKSTYMHMCSRPIVSVGDVVAAGQVLGCIGTTGTSTGDHLHFGIYKDGEPVNPMDYIG